MKQHGVEEFVANDHWRWCATNCSKEFEDTFKYFLRNVVKLLWSIMVSKTLSN